MNPKVFSAVPGVGRVYQCPNCEDLHLTIGPVDLRFPKESFSALVQLMNAADDRMHQDEMPAVTRGISWNAQRWSLC